MTAVLVGCALQVALFVTDFAPSLILTGGVLFTVGCGVASVLHARRARDSAGSERLAWACIAVGMLAATYALFPATLSWPVGMLADRFGSRWPLLIGTIPDKPSEPVAWTFKRADGGKSFYTSLGHPSDFKNPAFRLLLANAIRWAAAR